MKNKKSLIALFVLFTLFLLIPNSNAETKDCRYEADQLYVEFDLKIDRTDGEITAGTVRTNIPGDLFGGETIVNWSESITFKGSSFSGKIYYRHYQKCPPYVLYVKENDIKLYVTDDRFETMKSMITSYNPKIKETKKFSLVEKDPNEPEPIENVSTCLDFDDKSSCETDDKVACVWVEKNGYSYCNVDKLQYVKCGDAEDIPSEAPRIISFVINFFKIAAPILLVLVGAVSLAKAIASSSEDEMEKAKKALIKKSIYAGLVFFVIAIVQFVILKAADDTEEGSITSCLSCFLNNDCGNSLYYKTNVGGVDIRTPLNGGK